ncbi:GDP-mannose mannosyl hydrolase [Achromobacter aloeverae]|uniref:GDP-mannose mannosyl hydrolase n=1 Tax=Achromobacter aloeverae TaxID=1750518 RepID=A0A4Q1HRS4_9BURK|nr:NUDIX domain-containing protein [Achromobacter aloeverae]RXN93253.1 GDP-mannose mannosyl hydrolase [Achromobacter aloeverae]
MPAPRLSPAEFRHGVALLPLVSIDLLLRDAGGRYLIGLRGNPPARGSWFVPGGRIRKNESLHAALRRICEDELALSLPSDCWRLHGVYEHFYEDNFAGETDRGTTPHDTTGRGTTDCSTHYVVLAYLAQLPAHLGSLQAEDRLGRLPTDQHSDYRWAHPRAMAQDDTVHPYTRAYFTEQMR